MCAFIKDFTRENGVNCSLQINKTEKKNYNHKVEGIVKKKMTLISKFDI